jgi:hypothetical protein
VGGGGFGMGGRRGEEGEREEDCVRLAHGCY